VSADDELFDRVGHVLASRHPGWNFEPSTTPGGSPSWCLDPGGEITVSVTVIAVYLPGEDKEIPFADLDTLATWIESNQARLTPHDRPGTD
jgi:hypothetical protein